VRHWIGTVIVIAFAAIAPQTLATISASAVSVLLESLPYLAIATALTPLAGRFAHTLVAYTGCGCGTGPSARSIPAAIATAAIFGIPIAFARVLLASALARVHCHHEAVHGSLAGELVNLVPAALLAATMMQLVPMLPLHNLNPLALCCAGALLGLAASPCALGGVALAASLHPSAPIAAFGVLCTAGIVPVRMRIVATRDDALAYVLLALACALIATHHGGTFVHPRMTIPLALCAIYCAVLAWQARRQTARTPRWIAAAALAAIIIGAPAPTYRATETTLADAFPGEHVDFSGVAVRNRGASALVRYAITCCRADAAPVALALDRDVTHYEGRWVHARGIIEDNGGVLRLRVAELMPIAPPTDPFVYR
jgi:hypothetical protein